MEEPLYVRVCEALKDGMSKDEVVKEFGITKKQLRDALYRAKKKGMTCEPEVAKGGDEKESSNLDGVVDGNRLEELVIDIDELMNIVSGEKSEFLRRLDALIARIAELALEVKDKMHLSGNVGACVDDLDLVLGVMKVRVRYHKCTNKVEYVYWIKNGKHLTKSEVLNNARNIMVVIREYLAESLKEKVINEGVIGNVEVVKKYIAIVGEYNELARLYNKIFS